MMEVDNLSPTIIAPTPPLIFPEARVAKYVKGGVRMSDYKCVDETFEESLLIDDDIKEAENPCDGCAIIMGDDPCTVCPYQTAEVAAAIERRHNQ